MTMVDTATLADAPPVPLSAATATPRQRSAGIAMMLASSASNQTGAAVGAMAFPAIGPVGVVAVRQVVTALVLTPLVRPRFRTLRRDQWVRVVALATVFSVMNICLYAAVERIGLGPAVTLEFLGPLAVAIASSRRASDLGYAVVAGLGVVVLTNPGRATDLVGIGLALLAAASWASYILLNRSLGQRLPGLHGTAAASAVSAAVWVPIAAVWFTFHTPTAAALGLAVACGLLASTLPYAVDLLALRRVPAQMFSTFTSVNPVWAALAGLVFLDQTLGLHEWTGIALIVASNFALSLGQRRRRPILAA